MCNAHILVNCKNMGVFPYCALKVSIFSSPFFKVNFTGSGMVVAQSLTPGSHFTRGERINLRLKNS